MRITHWTVEQIEEMARELDTARAIERRMRSLRAHHELPLALEVMLEWAESARRDRILNGDVVWGDDRSASRRRELRPGAPAAPCLGGDRCLALPRHKSSLKATTPVTPGWDWATEAAHGLLICLPVDAYRSRLEPVAEALRSAKWVGHVKGYGMALSDCAPSNKAAAAAEDLRDAGVAELRERLASKQQSDADAGAVDDRARGARFGERGAQRLLAKLGQANAALDVAGAELWDESDIAELRRIAAGADERAREWRPVSGPDGLVCGDVVRLVSDAPGVGSPLKQKNRLVTATGRDEAGPVVWLGSWPWRGVEGLEVLR